MDVMADDRDARIAELEAELQRREAELREARAQIDSSNHALAESLEHQTVTAELLRVIATSPTDPQGVLREVAEGAMRVCDAQAITMYRLDGQTLHRTVVTG